MKKNWLLGKNIIITGATSGIGRELVELLLKEFNCNIIGVSKNEEKAERVFHEISAMHSGYSKYCFDVGEYDGWCKFAKILDEMNFKPDIIINNAGILPKFCGAKRIETQIFETVMKVDFFSAVYSFKVFCKDDNYPSFVNISSSAALATLAGTSAYTAAKLALRGFTESLSYELKNKSYVALVCPGFTKTNIFCNQNHAINEGIVGKISMPAAKMAKKIVRGMKRRKRKIILGKDAHLMSILYRIMPKSSTDIMSFVLKKSKMSLFEEIFIE